MEQDQKIIRVGGIFGIIGIFLFLCIGVGLEQLFWQRLGIDTIERFLQINGTSPYYQINMGGHFILGIAFLCMIVSFIGLYELLSMEKQRLAAKVGALFGVLACPIMVIQMSVQSTVMVKMGRRFLAATDEAQRQDVVSLYRGLRLFDQGIDLAFDTFFFLGWILLAFAMLSHRNFGKVFGLIGIILFGAAAVLNAWSAPTPPSFEMSPIVCLWVLAVFVQMLRAAKTSPSISQSMSA